VQVEALPDIDAELVAAYRQKFSKYRIVVADRKDIIHLSNRYTRSSIAEYLRALLPGHVVKRLQEIIDSHPHMTTEEQQIDFAYRLDISAVLEEYGCSIDALLDRESSLEVHRREIELLKRIDLSPGFLTSVITRLHGTLTASFYASQNITEAMVAQSIINYKLTPWCKLAHSQLRELSKELYGRIETMITTTIPTITLMSMETFNIFIRGSCVDRLIRGYGILDCGSTAIVNSCVESIEEMFRESKSDTNEVITLLARVWIMDSLAQVCNMTWDADRLEICKIGIVRHLLGHYMGQEDRTDAYDLFSFYTAMSRKPSVSLKRHTSIVRDIANLYRKDGYDDRASYIERECELLKENKGDGASRTTVSQ
jgi:hypothetical protein